MLDFVRKTFLGLTAALALGAGAAGAATVIEDNNTDTTVGTNIYTIDYGDTFAGTVTGNGGAGSWMVRFDALSDPISASALATVTGIVADSFTDLVMSWISVSDYFILASAAVPEVVIPVGNQSLGYTSLSTVFTRNGVDGGNDISQWLKFSWTGSQANIGFDVTVAAAVPVPAAGLLLLGALGGLAALRRRKSV